MRKLNKKQKEKIVTRTIDKQNRKQEKNKRRSSLKDTSLTSASLDWENKKKETCKQKKLTKTNVIKRH